MSEINPVGSTALMIAGLRAAEARRPHPLFVDPYAHLFLQEQVNAPARGWAADYPIFPSIIRERTRWFDDKVVEQLDAGATQVVVLGAGCCCRAERFARPGVTYYEVDQPGVLAFKAQRLSSAGHTYGAVAVARDYLAPGLFDALRDAGLDPSQRTLVLWEGNVYYLPEQEVRKGLAALAGSLPNVSIAVDYFGPDVIHGTSRAPGMRAAIQILARIGAPWTGWIDDVAQTAATSGLQVADRRTLKELHLALAPELDLGPDIETEYEVALLTNVPA